MSVEETPKRQSDVTGIRGESQKYILKNKKPKPKHIFLNVPDVTNKMLDNDAFVSQNTLEI